MSKIKISLDYSIPKEDRKKLISIVKKADAGAEVTEGDLSAMGGITWYPRDLIIFVASLTAAGFFAALGKDLYIQLRDRIKKLLSEDQPKAGAIYYSYLAFDIGSTVLYFEVDRINVYSIDRAYEKIIEDFPIIKKEVERLIQFKPNKLTGKFDSITF